MSVPQCSPSNLIELERFWKEEWEKNPKNRCASQACSIRLKKTWVFNCYQRHLSKILTEGCEYFCTCKIFVLFFVYNFFLLSLQGIVRFHFEIKLQLDKKQKNKQMKCCECSCMHSAENLVFLLFHPSVNSIPCPCPVHTNSVIGRTQASFICWLQAISLSTLISPGSFWRRKKADTNSQGV